MRTFPRANGRSVIQYDVSGLFEGAHLKAKTGENSVNGFRASGIYSVNRRLFRDIDVSPVGEEATDQMESTIAYRLQSGDSRSQTQESPSLSDKAAASAYLRMTYCSLLHLRQT